MKKKLTTLLVCIVCISALISLSACSTSPDSSNDDGKIKISVSFNALKEFATAVGGDKVTISTIIPDGNEPHDFEPKAQDLTALRKAEIFVISGLGMEPWASAAVEAAGNTTLITVDASTGVSVIMNADASNESTQYDPHIWLSLKAAEIEILNIKDALVKADPSNKAYYETNYDNTVSKLEQLYNDYLTKFESVTNKNFVTGHAAFAYLCRDFGLTQNSVEDVFAEGEPSAQQLASLIEYCKENHVTTVFSEALMNSDVADTLARETGATVQSIYTLESTENGKTYLERMEENLKVIYDSLTVQ